MILPIVLNSADPLRRERNLEQLLKTNGKTAQYGLTLNRETAGALIAARNEALKSCGRIELGMDAAEGLIDSFCSSAYINKENYTDTLNELFEIFYYMKNETEDRVGDEQLISLMRDCFENACAGSMELLRSTLEGLAENYRKNAQGEEALSGKESL